MKDPGSNAAPVKDSRFAAMHTDPRFARFPKKKNKISIDARFAGMFEDPDFQVASKLVDKRGKPLAAAAGQKRKGKPGAELQRYYRLRDEDLQQQQEAEPAVDATLQQQTADVVAATKPAGQKAKDSKQKPSSRHGPTSAAGKGNKALRASNGHAAANSDGEQSELSDDAAGSSRFTSSDPDEAGMQQEGQSGSDGDEQSESGADGDSSEEGEVEDAEAAAAERWARARGLVEVSSTSDEEDEEGNSQEEEEEEGVEGSSGSELGSDLAPAGAEEELSLDMSEWGVGAMAANPDEHIPTGEETRRLAAVDLDWANITAVDILSVMRSFAAVAGGASGGGAGVLKVTVYPSDYGLERMAQDAVAGPQGIWASKGEGAAAAKQKPDGQGSTEEEEGAGVDPARLRAYERSKLRWYYAIIECDTVATASKLYAEVDGLELERSTCKFDLRFVPDDADFSARQVRDAASEVPPGYSPPDMFTTGLQHTNPTLTWDVEDRRRKKALYRRLTEDELKDSDFAAYLASASEAEDEDEAGEGVQGGKLAEASSSSSGSESEGEDEPGSSGEERDEEQDGDSKKAKSKEADRYRQLLLGKSSAVGRVGGKSWGAGDGSDGDTDAEEEPAATAAAAKLQRKQKKSDKDYEMEVTFNTGLEALGQRLLAKKQEEVARKGETVWQAYLRKKAEKKAARKAMRGGRGGDSSSEEDYDQLAEDKGAKQRGSKAGKGPREAAAAGGGSSEDEEDAAELAAAAAADPWFKEALEEDPFNDPFFQDGAGSGQPAAANGDAQQTQQQQRKDKGKDKDRDGSKARKAAEKAAAAKQAAELELLLMDDGALQDAARGVGSAKGAAARVVRGAAAADAGKAKPRLSRKEKKRALIAAKKAARAGSDEEDAGAAAAAGDGSFQPDLEDPRFKGLFTDHAFALDPTDPRFTKMEGSKQVAAAVRRKRQQQLDAGEQDFQQQASTNGLHESQEQQQQHVQQAASAQPRQKTELAAMVAKLKRKQQQQQQKPESAKRKK